MGFLVNVSNVDEAVQSVDGVFVIDAEAIYDLMYGAYRPLVIEKEGLPFRCWRSRKA